MNQPWNVVTASQIGCILDCNLSNGTKIGGGTATDNTAKINGVLATASATNPIKLILDGPTLCSGIIFPPAGNVWIEGIGFDSGIYIASGSNADGIVNTKTLPFDGGVLPGTLGQHVIISNFLINGNRGNGTTGNSNSGNPRGVSGTWWYCNINISAVNFVRIYNMYIYDAPAYSIRLNGCNDVRIDNCTIYNPNATAGPNNDCVHIDGPSIDGQVTNCRLYNNASDDGVALNAPEGFAGVITNWVVANNVYDLTYTGLRIYGQGSASVGQVIFANNNGLVSNAVVIGGVGATTAQDVSGQAISLDNNTFQITNGTYFSVTGFLGDVSFNNCVHHAPSGTNGWIYGTFAGSTVSHVSINDCRVYRNTTGSAVAPLVAATAAMTISRMTINGFQIVNEAGQAYSALANLLVMANVTISNLYLEALDYALITALASTYTGLTNIYGPAFQPLTNIQSKSGAYTILPTDRTILGNTTSASFAVTLPATAYAGMILTIKNTGTANTLTVTGTVDGSANPTLTTLVSTTILYDGSAWRKIG